MATVAVAAVVVLGIGQLVIPPLAEEAVREAVDKYGKVQAVRVEATPAVTLLWREAELVEVRSPALVVPAAELVDLDHKAAHVETARLQAGSLQILLARPVPGTVTFQEVVVEKRGERFSLSGVIGPGDVSLDLPGGIRVVGVKASEGLPELLVGASLGPLQFEIGGVAAASEGAIVARPAGFGPLGALAQITVYASPRLYFERLEATQEGERVRVVAAGTDR